MRRILLLTYIVLIVLVSCQPAPPPTPTLTPLPPTQTPVPPTPTPPPAGISGTVEYTGPSKGGILILVTDHPQKPNEPPQPTAVSTFNETSGEFQWDLPPGTYYINAFLTIDRPPEGPTQPNEPLVFCDPLELKVDERVIVDVILTDDDIGGKTKACVETN